MSTSLHDRLSQLAEDAPAGGPVPGLWDRGRRYQQRRRVGTLVLAAAVVLGLVALGSLDWWRSQAKIDPASGTPALPQRVWVPSPWLPGTDETGPLGQLAVVQHATRGSWTGEHDALAGVSADTGEYAFLDLPDAVYTLPPHAVELAPDGRHVAYLYSGDTAKSPNTDSGPVVGVAIYDTATGEVIRQPVPTDHGLMVDNLAWIDAHRVVFDYYQLAGGDADPTLDQSSGGDFSGLLLWDTTSGQPPTQLPGSRHGDRQVEYAGDGHVLTDLALVDVDTGNRVGLSLRPESVVVGAMAVDRDAQRVSWIGGSSSPNHIRVAPIQAGTVRGQVVSGSRGTFGVRAWIDDEHVAVVQRGKGIGPSVLGSVDVRTGASTDILRLPSDTYGTTTELAVDLLATPAVDRAGPPRPLDPRKVTGGAAALVLGGLGALLVWRRRVRP